MADIILDATSGVHRPRNLDWKRAAALLYGDWGTSKAYVIGLAFVAAGLGGWSARTSITSGAAHVQWIKMLRDHIAFTTIGMLLIMGLINYFGPKHSGSFAVALALPTAVIVIVLIAISAPHFTTHFLEPRHKSLGAVWVQFVGVILALSGAESIANLTGVLKLDPGSRMEH